MAKGAESDEYGTGDNSGKRRRKADYLVLKHLKQRDEPLPHKDLIRDICSTVDSLNDVDNINTPVGYVQSTSNTGMYSRSVAEALDRCIGAGYIEQAEDGYKITESGRVRLSEDWLSHFGISTDFVRALDNSLIQDQADKAKVASD